MAKIIPGASAQAVKRKQYILLIAAAAAVAIVAVVAGYATQSRQPALPVADATKPVARNIAVPGESVKEEQSWRAIEGARLESVAKDLATLRAESEALRKELAARATTPQSLPPGVVPPPQRVAEQPAPVTPPPQQLPALPPPPSRAGVPGAFPESLDTGPKPAIATVSFDEEPSTGGAASAARRPGARAAQPAAAEANADRKTYLPAGTFMSGVLLNGLDAPTGGQAQNNPQPILLQITDNAVLPNRMRAEMRGCFATAFAHGDLSSERGLGRVDRITCTSEEGAAIDVPVRGYLVGPDGKVGIGGKVVSKAGRLLANAAAAGVLSGLAAVAESYSVTNSVSALGTVQTIDTDKIPQYAVASGLQSAADKLASYFLKMADQMVPVVEVPAGVKVDIVLQRGLSLEIAAR